MKLWQAEINARNGSAELLTRAIAMGLNPDIRIIRKVAQNLDVDNNTLPEDLWNGGGLYTGFPAESATPERFSVVSSSALDTAAGTGARTVRIVGLDANWNEYEEVVPLNGILPVLTVGTWRRFTRAQVQSSGGVVLNTGFNAGTITGRYETTATSVFFAMPPGLSNTRTGGYTVPVGWQGLLFSIRIDMDRATAASIEGELFFQTAGGAPRLIRPFVCSNVFSYIDRLDGGVVLPAKTDIIPRVRIASTTNISLYCSYELMLFKDP